MPFFDKILSGMVNSVPPDQNAPSGSALFAYSIFVRNFAVQNFRIATIGQIKTFNIQVKTISVLLRHCF